AEALARLEAEAARRGVAVEVVVNELAARLPAAAEPPITRHDGLIGLGASSSGRHARDADEMLAEGFGRS
ncbi:MAG: hypothetical protein AAFP84_21120, partial [Actinomycetota bacterium]